MVGEDDRARAGAFRVSSYVFAPAAGGWIDARSGHRPATTPVYPSVTPLVPAAHWYEREVQDLLGLEPEGHPDPRRLVLHDDWPDGVYPLRKDFDPAVPVPRGRRASRTASTRCTAKASSRSRSGRSTPG